MEKKAEKNTEIIAISNFRTKKIPPLVWRECTPRAFASRHIKKVWEVDPLLCSHCGSLMKIISFIYERKVIIRILDHLGLLKGAKPKRDRAPPVSVDTCGGTSIEPNDDGWPEYEEPFVDVQTL
jgi:hypothetical protein